MAQAIIWTEGKTDGQYLARARQLLECDLELEFPVSTDLGDDQLLKQCIALSRVPQPIPVIFLFDRDSPEIVAKISDGSEPYKSWGNNVFSFAIPAPTHRSDISATCIELYFRDEDLCRKNEFDRRIFLSSEFNPKSGRHLVDASIGVPNRGKLVTSNPRNVRILDSDVYDAAHKNIALSKSEFSSAVCAGVAPFDQTDFSEFKAIFAIVEKIVATNNIDLWFSGLEDFVKDVSELPKVEMLAAIVETSVRVCKLSTMLFTGLTIRHYNGSNSEGLGIDQKKLRPIRQTVIENFAAPSLVTVIKTARQCFHLVEDSAPDQLQHLRSVLAENPVLDAVGDLLDDIERVLPPAGRRARIIVKRNTKKQLLEYVLPELAKYETRIAEIRDADSEILESANPETWVKALQKLVEWFRPLKAFSFRVGNIVRLQSGSDKFVVKFTTYRAGRALTHEVQREYADLTGDRVETFEINASTADPEAWLDIYPFMTVKDQLVHFYCRTRAVGYQYIPALGASVHIIPTKRRFSHAALEGTIVADRQMLFWTRVAPAVSAVDVRANIPAHDPSDFVGRKQQIAKILDEVVQIPNENGLLHGPGGVGKTALLIELSRKLFEEGFPAKAPFKNIIWVSAKRDYYDPTLDVIEEGSQQFKTLDQIFIAVLEFHGFEEPEQYPRFDQRWLVLELFEEQKTLLILDNFETIAAGAQEEIIRFFGTEVKRHLIDKPDNFKVLLTSREVMPSGFHQIQLKGLDKRESNTLMSLLYQSYASSGQAQLTENQRSQLYDATKGIPLLIKHCYGQVYEYNMPFDAVVKGLVVAGNKVVEFSFAEIFRFLKDDELQRKILILLEVINRPTLIRQMADILNVDLTSIERRIANLMNFPMHRSFYHRN
jgi:RNA-directed DNA polymerase